MAFKKKVSPMLIDELMSPMLTVIKCYLKPFFFSKDCGCIENLDRLKYTKEGLDLKFGESSKRKKEDFEFFRYSMRERERERIKGEMEGETINRGERIKGWSEIEDCEIK